MKRKHILDYLDLKIGQVEGNILQDDPKKEYKEGYRDGFKFLRGYINDCFSDWVEGYILDTSEGFGSRFDDVLNDASNEYARHFPEKGDSWEAMDIDSLRFILLSIFKSWVDEGNPDNEFSPISFITKNEYNEMLDIINVCLMLGERLRKTQK